MEKTMSVKEFSKIYNIGMNNAYKIVNTVGFPAIRIGRKILIIRDQVDNWFLENINTTIN
ncbi:MAG: helix-turn-helix domain-containing protein [Intestinibacter bartlettii]|nr:helix-turn-helix domain-containing protein [Intestinibacter bartlettii]